MIRLDIATREQLFRVIHDLRSNPMEWSEYVAVIVSGDRAIMIVEAPSASVVNGRVKPIDRAGVCHKMVLERLEGFLQYVMWIDGRCEGVRPNTRLINDIVDVIYGDYEVELHASTVAQHAARHERTAHLAQERLQTIVSDMLTAAGA